MEQNVHLALAMWGMESAHAQLVAQRENHVYRVEYCGQVYALRLHRPGYRTADELISELNWCAHLADQGLHVPRPIADRNGCLLNPLADTHVSVLQWLNGAPIGQETTIEGDPLAMAKRVGREMARLHTVTDSWQPPDEFIRPDWTLEALIGDTPLWGPYWDHPELTSVNRSLFDDATRKARDNATLFVGDTGLIHADLVSENLLVNGTRIGLLDFDDSAIGYRAFELATFLIRYVERPDFDALRSALITGYADRRVVSTDELDLALLLRALTYVGWIIPRRSEPGGEARSKRMISRALRQANSYLKRSPS
ncbi:phosphotransferase enzyme family protein [Shimia abyssi]|uniref:Ser/Thr protein kinase RdoA (MazF antagonist) n=1 Tax=Shimia abyssi TaxID=1662395 RepID=A0A2P8F838_9RHOB|nr:phosphotransferase [Shimia abyssi]PSL17878.1 Ser/Thr protein kinase RdoA (MazF antagonist) [Shimia abyssi]